MNYVLHVYVLYRFMIFNTLLCEYNKSSSINLSIQVPGRLSAAELRAMALRQQQQIDSQHQVMILIF